KKSGIVIALSLLLSAAAAHAQTTPKQGGASGMSATGSAAGGSSQGANSQLEYCPESLGTLAVVEDTGSNWWSDYVGRYPRLGSTVPVLRMMIQQSNCFVVVERGQAMGNVMQERGLEDSGELRGGSNFGKGQMVAADYTMSPSIQFAAKGTGGLGGALGGLIGGSGGRVLGAIAGGVKSNEAATTLLLVDNRSAVQIAAAVGSAKNMDFNLLGGAIGRSAGGSVGAFSNTPEGKVITAAFADSYNQMVRSLRSYRAQTVEGGLGRGGRLGVAD
ncbi:MAG: CsgG/HfaB family protein, partial [Porticoccaceae bacterium]|nr:CsgG/HfaB family protein [Porticoccaceae bacterium]